MRTRTWTLFLLGFIALIGNTAAHASDQASVTRVVYHLDADREGTTTALHQAKNQLLAAPGTRIVVVALGSSVRYLVKDAETRGGYPFELMVSDLQERGVRFEACGNTMATLQIKPSQLDDGVKVVPSGMAEIARLQAHEGYVYIRP